MDFIDLRTSTIVITVIMPVALTPIITSILLSLSRLNRCRLLILIMRLVLTRRDGRWNLPWYNSSHMNQIRHQLSVWHVNLIILGTSTIVITVILPLALSPYYHEHFVEFEQAEPVRAVDYDSAVGTNKEGFDTGQ